MGEGGEDKVRRWTDVPLQVVVVAIKGGVVGGGGERGLLSSSGWLVRA
jgi:hypothetical protein